MGFLRQLLFISAQVVVSSCGQGSPTGRTSVLRTFARKFSNIDFFLKLLPLKDDELLMTAMLKNGG